mmetsp:Transcript_26720/g.44665  ORF Transcript_26720/g.44665 Transcript_26720/m.44665 type:complete len:248 (-) Transcript_26720:207-950(-)
MISSFHKNCDHHSFPLGFRSLKISIKSLGMNNMDISEEVAQKNVRRHEENIKKIVEIFDNLTRSGDSIFCQTNDKPVGEDNNKEYYRNTSVSIVKMKSLNRQIYAALDDRRSQNEKKKVDLDKLQLNYQNLLYKQAYLKREIRACKDLSTPHLNDIEREIGKQLGTTVYSDNLESINEAAKRALEEEKTARVNTDQELKRLKEQRNEALKRLDRKRKFMDDLPAKVEIMASTAKELSTQFQEVGVNQ